MMLLPLLLLAAAAAPPPPPAYPCVAATRPVAIDGNLVDAAWAAARWTADFIPLHAPGDDDAEKPPRPPSPPRTRAKVSWDAENLYVAAELGETDVRAEMRAHDDPLYRENALEVFIDPDGDGENYLELQVNALNTTLDLLMSRPYSLRGKAEPRFDVENLRTAVRVQGTLNDPSDEDESWTVEMAIPWKSLHRISTEGGLPPRADARWRINFARTIVSRDGDVPTRYATWSPIEGRSLHAPQRWGWLEFQQQRPPPAVRAHTPDPASTPPARKRR